MAVDLTSDSAADLERYTVLHKNVVDQSRQAEGLTRSVIMAHFNDSYCYGRDVRINSRSVMMYHIRADIDKYDTVAEQYLKRVLSLCLKSDICQKLNMSMVELMEIDYPTFEFIEREYYKHKPIEQDIVAEVQREMERNHAAAAKKTKT